LYGIVVVLDLLASVGEELLDTLVRDFDGSVETLLLSIRSLPWSLGDETAAAPVAVYFSKDEIV
jgi:hypothetical protein